MILSAEMHPKKKSNFHNPNLWCLTTDFTLQPEQLLPMSSEAWSENIPGQIIPTEQKKTVKQKRDKAEKNCIPVMLVQDSQYPNLLHVKEEQQLRSPPGGETFVWSFRQAMVWFPGEIYGSSEVYNKMLAWGRGISIHKWCS